MRRIGRGAFDGVVFDDGREVNVVAERRFHRGGIARIPI